MTDEPSDNGNTAQAASTPINVAFWNLQNLFDLNASAIAADFEYTPVHGWDRRALQTRIRNLAEVIRLMFDGDGPDLLGVCEIESARVARILIDALGRDDYVLAEAEHPGLAGLDTSLIYSTRVFDSDQTAAAGHVADLRYATQDVLEVRLKVRRNQCDLVVLVNHWPSRRCGSPEAEALRMTAASCCRRLVDRTVKMSRKEYLQLKDSELSLLELQRRWDRNVLVMGDLNDEPWDRSVREVLRGVYSLEPFDETVRLSRGALPSYKAYDTLAARLFNPMWGLAGMPDSGTTSNAGLAGAAEPTQLLDQFLLSRGLCLGLSGLQPQLSADGIPEVNVFRPEVMRTRRNRPREYRRETRAGYSDHFPITMSLRVL
ncbi:MAG: hypothetical protein RIK87_08780 [Fuerstiella sp.]